MRKKASSCLFRSSYPVICLFVCLFLYLSICTLSWMPKTTLGRSHDGSFSDIVSPPTAAAAEFRLAKDL